eukprot:m.34227 g.34227  ORF g.34227 m.34227 type:complete len:313 (+) comp43460_c0_seq2:785-1723(+)
MQDFDGVSQRRISCRKPPAVPPLQNSISPTSLRHLPRVEHLSRRHLRSRNARSLSDMSCLPFPWLHGKRFSLLSRHDLVNHSQSPACVGALLATPTIEVNIGSGHPYTLKENSSVLLCNLTMDGSWIKTSDYVFVRVTRVTDIINKKLQERYEAYVRKLASEGVTQDCERLFFHGTENKCDGRGCKGVPCGMCGIISAGFLKRFMKTAAGAWQRFGPGFYFATNSSKSHEYPLGKLASGTGEHEKTLLLCKVAIGRPCITTKNMDYLDGAPPAGYHSVHGRKGEHLNYDEIVTYEEESILPTAIVHYVYKKA